VKRVSKGKGEKNPRQNSHKLKSFGRFNWKARSVAALELHGTVPRCDGATLQEREQRATA
jgi:hypothetical protein